MMGLRPGPVLAAMMLVVMVLTELALSVATAAAAERALLLEIDGAIGPPIADYIVRELGAARSGEVRLIILRMNTPGGLDTSMRQIISAILASPVPVVTYVAPNGARAASAGTYIAYASAIAAMAPSTNIGAATPVQFGGNPLLPADQKQQGEQKPQEASPANRQTPRRARSSTTPSRIFAASPHSMAAMPIGPSRRCVPRQACRPPRRSRFTSSMRSPTMSPIFCARSTGAQ